MYEDCFARIVECRALKKPSVVGGYNVFPLAHCGSMGTANRNKDKPKKDDKLYYQKKDWESIRNLINS